jgi:hypothetical protein
MMASIIEEKPMRNVFLYGHAVRRGDPSREGGASLGELANDRAPGREVARRAGDAETLVSGG